MQKNYYKNTYKKGFNLLELFIVILMVWLIATQVKPNHFRRVDPFEKSMKKCFYNQKILNSAIELYNMDSSVMLDKAFPGPEADNIIKLLENKHYLKDFNQSVDKNCSYGFVDLLGYGSVFCVLHGTIESDSDKGAVFPEPNILSDDKPYISEYKNLKDNMLSESRKLKKRMQNSIALSDLIFDSPLLPGSLLVIVIIGVVVYSINKKKSPDKK